MKAALLAAALAVGTSAFGHGGGLDAQGCHTNRKTGDYHCHRPQAGGTQSNAVSQQAPPPSKQARGDPTCHVGPRGGTYTITPSGRKNYKGC